MSQGILLFISACLIAVVVAKDDGNALSDEFPSSQTSRVKPMGPLQVVPPAATRLKSLEKAAPIEITKDSIPFPRLSPADRERHMEVLREFQLHLNHNNKDSHPQGEGQDNEAEEQPEIDISSANDLHGNDN